MTAPMIARPVDELADRYWLDFLDREPVTGTVLGFDGYDDRLSDPSPAGRARERAANEKALADARNFDRTGVSADDAVTLDLLEVIAETALEVLDTKLY